MRSGLQTLLKYQPCCVTGTPLIRLGQTMLRKAGGLGSRRPWQPPARRLARLGMAPSATSLSTSTESAASNPTITTGALILSPLR